MLKSFSSHLTWKLSWTPFHKWSPLFQGTWTRLSFPLQNWFTMVHCRLWNMVYGSNLNWNRCIRLLGCHQNHSTTVSWQSRGWCNYGIKRPIKEYSIQSEGKSLCREANMQWMKRGQEPCLSNPCVSRQRNMTKHERLDKKLFNEVEQKNIEITSYSFLEFQPRLQF